MKKLDCRTVIFVFSVSLLLVLLPGFKGFAQQTVTNINQYVLFGGWTSTAGSYGIDFGSNSIITGNGLIGSPQSIKSTGALQLTGSVYSGGKIVLSNSNTISGRVSAASGTNPILQTGTAFKLGGNADIKGNISIGLSGSQVSGIVTQPSGATYAGPAATRASGAPDNPVLPSMPAITDFTPYPYGTVSASSGTIVPGKYKYLNPTGGKTITFSGPGIYVFKEIDIDGNDNTLVFDFKGLPGNIIIYVHNDVFLLKTKVSILGGGSAARIYTETHGNGSTNDDYTNHQGCAWTHLNTTSGSGNGQWKGTIWAPYGSIQLGFNSQNSDYEGAFWSGKQIMLKGNVNLKYNPMVVAQCNNPTADAGQSLNPKVPCTGLTPSVQLQGSSTGITNPTYSWTTVNGNIISGATTATPTVTTAGTYVLVVSNSSGCSATAQVKVTSCVDQAVDGNPLKVATKLDAVLTQLIANPSYINTPFLFTFDPNDKTRILIEAILQDNTLATANSALTLLNANGFSQTSISNNSVYYIITGFFPIANLANLENPVLFNNIRAVVPPVTLAAEVGGLYKSGGDSAMGTRSARAGYDITGAQYKRKDGTTQNIKIGVISDSYNKKGAAANDVATGELPADVELPNGDFPFGNDKSDEGRAMLQIIHEQAPGAKLAFRTGFISEGDMAEGIRQLKNAGCNIIVDDITYATTPFFRDGLVTKAIKEVVKDSVLYFTSAGNFSNKSYEGTFSGSLANGTAIPVPGVVAPQNNTLQRIELSKAGSYMIILQWDDFFYSANDPGITTGAVFDLDIFLTDYTGKNILGYNRINTGSDPLEIMPFTVADATTVYLKIVMASGQPVSGNISYKYILFQGSGKILDNANANPSTIIGHANSQEAMTVGAVQYNLTPAYGVASNLVKIEPFSSWGGPTNGIDNKKPDFSAPDGVNTSVYLGDRPLTNISGGVFLDPDTKPGLAYNNFFGTSAAAPHAAGLAALLLEARLKYNPGKPAFGYKTIRSVFKTTASNIIDASDDATGFDYKSGSGLLDAYKALLTEANPKPLITSIQSVETTTTSDGKVKINIKVDGNYLVTTTYIEVNGVQVPTTVDLQTKTLTAIIEPFSGNPDVKVCSPAIAVGDGQCSNSINLLDPTRTKITVRAKPYTKTYGTPLPPDPNAVPFSYEILIGDSPTPYNPSQPLPGGLTLLKLGLAKPGLQPGDPVISTVSLNTTASNSSTAGQPQVIHPVIDGFETSIPLEFAKLYNYVILDGVLSIERLKVTITPKSQTITYGAEVGPVEFDYTTPGTSNVDPAILLDIKTEHLKWIANGYALVKGFDASQLENSNLAMMITETGLINANKGITRANGGVTRANVVDVSPEALNTFLQNRIISNGGVTRANGIPYDNAATRANGGVTRANGGVTRANTIVNADALINGFIVVTSNGGATRANVSGASPNANGGVTRANGITRANYITFTQANGGVTRANVVLNSDASHTAYPFADLTVAGNSTAVNAIANSGIDNGVLTNGSGDVSVVNTSLFSATSNSNVAVLVDDEDVDKGYVEGYVSINMVTGLTATNETPHLIIPGAFLPLNPNYDISYGTGDLVVNKAPLAIAANNKTKVYGEPVDFTNTVTGFVYDPETDLQDNNTIVYPAGIDKKVTAVVNSVIVPFTGPIYPAGMYTIQPIFAPVANYVVNPPQGSNGILTITKADQTITWDNPAAIKYGTALSGTQLNATAAGVPGGSDPGALTYSPASGVLLATGIQTLKVDAAETDNYNAATKSVVITVNKADQTISWTNPAAITYGTALSSTQLNAIASGVANGPAPGALTYTPAAGTLPSAGTQTLKVDAAETDTYAAATFTVTITVNKADQTITWSNPAAITYGKALSGTELNAAATGVSGGTAPGALTYSPPTGTILTTGLKTLRVDAAATVNYNAAFKEVSLQVDKGSLSITIAKPIYYFNYGGTLPAFSSTITGLAPGDVVSNNTYVTSGNAVVTSTLAPGTYSITRNINSTNLVNFSSYTIASNQAATLYVNPYGGTTKSVKPYTVCVQKLTTPVNGYYYRARFTYRNANSVAVYVPLGTDNKITPTTGALFAGNPPELFLPGINNFDIYFNGVKITWTISSIEGVTKSSSSTFCNLLSLFCGILSSKSTDQAYVAATDIVIRESIYPNPATNMVSIEGDFDKISEKDVVIMDLLGRQIKPGSVRKVSPRVIQIDISNMVNSQYFISVNSATYRKVFKFIKQ